MKVGDFVFTLAAKAADTLVANSSSLIAMFLFVWTAILAISLTCIALFLLSVRISFATCKITESWGVAITMSFEFDLFKKL